MYKIILIEPVLAHYQKDVWTNLRKSENFVFKIIAGKNYLGIKSLKDENYTTFDYFSFKILKHTLYFLKGSIHYIIKEKPEAIISFGVDFHHLHILAIFFFFKIIRGKRFFWWSHGASGNQGKIGIAFRRFFYKHSTGVFLYSQHGKDNLIKMGVAGEKLQVVGNSLNTIEYGFLHYDIINKSHNDVFTILYCGRINANKKLDVLIKSLDVLLRKQPFDFRCTIVGGGDFDAIKRLTSQLGLSDKIHFVGPKYDAEIHPYFLHSDLFVYPGGIGLSLVQALSFGLPVITTDNPALHGPEIELLRTGINGDFFIDNSFTDLAEKIEKWHLKLLGQKNDDRNRYIQGIIDLGYLPKVVSEKVIEFLYKDFNIFGN